MLHTYTTDVKLLIQFAKDQGWDILDIVGAYTRLEMAIAKDLYNYSILALNKPDS